MSSTASASRPRARRHTDSPPATNAESLAVAPSDVARRAYERFLARGGTHGNDLEDWLAAETELRRDLVSIGS